VVNEPRLDVSRVPEHLEHRAQHLEARDVTLLIPEALEVPELFAREHGEGRHPADGRREGRRRPAKRGGDGERRHEGEDTTNGVERTTDSVPTRVTFVRSNLPAPA